VILDFGEEIDSIMIKDQNKSEKKEVQLCQ